MGLRKYPNVDADHRLKKGRVIDLKVPSSGSITRMKRPLIGALKLWDRHIGIVKRWRVLYFGL